MEIVRIFEDIEEDASLLWSVKYENESTPEYERLLELWQDVAYLEEFFEKHKAELQTPFWGGLQVAEATDKTIDEAWELGDMVYELAHGNSWNNKRDITELFRPLVKQDNDSRNKRKYKARPDLKHPFLRLYAVKLEDDTYLVTGGAIKLTKEMEGEEMEREKRKMDQVKLFLKENGINYLDDLTTY